MEIKHDPDARLDYAWDWSDWLQDGETIDSHSIVEDPLLGVNVETSAPSLDNKKIVAWVSGGEVNTAVSLTCHIVSSANREDDRTIDLWVAER